MTTVSGCTLVRNAVKLRYPLEASILTYYPLCDEVVISYDPTTNDGTDAFIKDLCRRYSKIRAIPSPWNMKNHEGGTEITIQSNVAAEACTSDWVLYVQADEAIHEGDHDLIRSAVNDRSVNGLLFARRSFLGTLDREIPEYYARNLLRLYRNGQGCVVGDGMTCGYFQGIRPSLRREQPRMFNYSRMGSKAEVVERSKCRDNFHIPSESAIEANVANEYTQAATPFDPGAHPEAIRTWYGREGLLSQAPSPVHRDAPMAYPVTLAFLMGPGERANLAPFLWQFRRWKGDVVVFDDTTVDGASGVLEHTLREVLKFDEGRYTIIRGALSGDFGSARNRLQEAAKSPWVLMTAPDERWDVALIEDMPQLVSQLDRDRKIICGFPRANFVDGVLVNDIPDTKWTESGLLERLPGTTWPPANGDIQYCLLRKEERWQGRIHERPSRLTSHPEGVVSLRDHWVLHSKTFNRQKKQDAFYRSLGQTRGMPSNEPVAPAPSFNLREATLIEALDRLPGRRLTIVETGTLRNGDPRARLTDGWSTYVLAEQLAKRNIEESTLYSIDIDPRNIDVSKSIVPGAWHPWVRWICGDSKSVLRSLDVETIDILYLDSSDDSRQIMAEFDAALPKLAEHSLVIVDDTGYAAPDRPEGKGTVLIPTLRGRGWQIERRDTDMFKMVILTAPQAQIVSKT